MGSNPTLKEYFDKVLEERYRHHLELLRAAEREIDAKSKALEIRLESMNEFRDQIQNERAEYARKENMKELSDRVSKVELSISNQSGRFWAFGFIFAITFSIFNIFLAVVLRKFIG